MGKGSGKRPKQITEEEWDSRYYGVDFSIKKSTGKRKEVSIGNKTTITYG